MNTAKMIDDCIFAIPVGNRFGCNDTDVNLIYAPLSNNMLLADTATVATLEQTAISPVSTDSEYSDLLAQLKTATDLQIRNSTAPDVYQTLYVLPNYFCNLSCSYCYSAKGRSGKHLSEEHLRATLDYFVDSARCGEKPLKISFVGGGEPLLSWDIVKQGVEYANKLASSQNIKLHFGFITNGTVVSPEIINTVKKYNVHPRISFEILEDLQNKQRGQYDKVCRTLDLLAEAGITTEIRSVITQSAVERIEEMVEEVFRRFPFVRTVYFDPVADHNLFRDVNFTRTFYNTYREAMLKARRIAASNGKNVLCAVSRSLETISDRYCNGEFCLTPEGTVSICLEVSSPDEETYSQNIYGAVNGENILVIDREKYSVLRQNQMADIYPECCQCFVKWNCGGGCTAERRRYTVEIQNVICDFVRDFSCDLLLEKLDETEMETSGSSLMELITQNLKNK
ncbi:MAG: radical SAM protein [Prevotellaceae bacterium]|jgi:radical SAM protein with 4Fe4S-binding SPASM domain|nr:radical SAM protein [Prevotellaceae bacterium]